MVMGGSENKRASANGSSDLPGDLQAELEAFEKRERRRLGLDEPLSHWQDENPQIFTKAQRSDTTILFGGLTRLHDQLIETALRSLGYRAESLSCPDNQSLQVGKEFGSRGQCNPTYFTVGNLVKYLTHLRDDLGMSPNDIVSRYLFVTAGACGPCRFGMYVTEYRKALRDAGFDGFRVLLFQNSGSINQAAGDTGLELTPRFFITLIKCLVSGDVLNALMYRIRPYEIEAGSTDRAIEQCEAELSVAIKSGSSMVRALRRCRKILKGIEVDRLQPKPKVSIIGEFWAMTTEGDGNYRLQRFLEAEGAECEVQMVTSWLLYSIWQIYNDTRARLAMRRRNGGETGKLVKKLCLARLGRLALERTFYTFARSAGLGCWHLPDMDELAAVSDAYYRRELRGGEGHMEVGKVIQATEHKKAHLVISVKPFGCMPSSGVSDGVQSLVTARYPDANFLPIETSGDGAVNIYSRVQMALFKARQQARVELEEALAKTGLDKGTAARRLRSRGYLHSAVHYPGHVVAGTAANTVYELG